MMDFEALKNNIPTSPAFVVDEEEVHKSFELLSSLRASSGCKVLYSIKALSLAPILELSKSYLDGFSVSSLFEVRLANEILAGQGNIHLTTPGIKPDEIEELLAICSHISCNSLGQYRQLVKAAEKSVSIGIRINPKLSFTEDERHDPCRMYSKLGVALNELLRTYNHININGLHFHTVFSATDFKPLIETVGLLRHSMGALLGKLDWLNLGGGYLFGEIEDNRCFIELVSQLKADFDLDVYIEPGNAVVGKAGYLVATVVDCFDSDGKAIAVLDTSVNHQPQVFEYQRQPELVEHNEAGPYAVMLVGSTCLAGDVFGEYRFDKPLSLGDRVVFKHVGAYSLVKANRFNGYNLPDVYLASAGGIKRIKQHTYQNYRQQWLSDE